MITIMHLNLENESSLLPWQLINSTMTLYMESIYMQGVLTEKYIAGGAQVHDRKKSVPQQEGMTLLYVMDMEVRYEIRYIASLMFAHCIPFHPLLSLIFI